VLQELFTREGKGSLVSGDNFDLLRQATINDVAGILALITPLEQNGTLVTRSRELLENEIANFQVVELEGSLIACAAFYPLSQDAGELACIAIDEHYRNKGYGNRLLHKLEANAKAMGFNQVFVLTTVTDHWFIEKGFKVDSIDGLPEGKKLLYNYQRNSKVLSKGI
jgi:amino-acid N-acetyltransferase